VVAGNDKLERSVDVLKESQGCLELFQIGSVRQVAAVDGDVSSLRGKRFRWEISAMRVREDQKPSLDVGNHGGLYREIEDGNVPGEGARQDVDV
jgi:hypothetical protein